jgi:hypothetical protein
MYWYKSKSLYRAVLIAGISCSAILPACNPDIKDTGSALKYFDLKGYFYADSARLTKLNRPVLKTVIHNGVSQSKKVHISNWGTELGLLVGSDINKPAWKDSYTVQTTPTTLIYAAKYPELQTQNIIINKADNKVKWIMIINHTKNMLYETKEKLTYFPDSMYMIEKVQSVRLLGSNRYDIKGIFN